MNKTLAILSVVLLYTSGCTSTSGGLPRPNYMGANYKTVSQKLPQTTLLDKELRSIHKSLLATSARVKKAKTTVTNGRYAAQAAEKMIDQIPSVENQVARLEREVKSISKIPKFKMLDPVAKALSRLKGKITLMRKRADQIKKFKIQPAIKKMKKIEAKLTNLKSKLDHASLETVTAVGHLNSLRSFVISQNFPDIQVRALEALSKTTRYPVAPVKKALTEFDSACIDLEKQINTFKGHLNKLTKLKPGLDKVKNSLKPIDKKIKSIAKVLDKKLEFKIPLSKGKKVSFTVRKIIEAPGKILDIAVKPLTKAADKLLKPLTKNLKFNIKPPKEIQKISAQLDSLNRFSLNIDRPAFKLDSPVNLRAVEDYRNSIKKFSSTKNFEPVK